MDVSDEEPDPRRRRGYHSGGHQDVHTDSCDIVSMLSIRVAKSGGASTLVSAHALHNIMLDTCPGLLQVFYDGLYLRTTDTDAAAAGRPALSPHRVPAFRVANGQLNCSYVRGYVDRAVAAGDVQLSAVEKAAVEVFTAFSNHPELCFAMMLEPGDMQFVNNRTLLHGRAQFEDHAEKSRRRHLLRLWLTVPDWDRLPAEQDNPFRRGEAAMGRKCRPAVAAGPRLTHKHTQAPRQRTA
ncbi:MAG: TauD/TfdA family dioxygenase [Acetobacteraceae bacterium]